MKFTDGFWLMRGDLTAYFPTKAYDVDTEPRSMTAYAPTHQVRHRGDLLKGPVVTVSCSSPMTDVIRVTATHFAGAVPARPQFGLLAGQAPEVVVTADADAAVLTSGALSVRVARSGPWRVEFSAGGRPLTASGTKALAIVDTDAGRHHVREQLDLGVGHCVYGLGERFGPFVKNGQVVDIWNNDGGTASEQAYKNVPFYLTNAGYGVFVNTPGHVSFEVASEVVSRVQFSVEGQTLEYFVIYGPSPKEILRKYTALTGRPALPPAWSFGLWLSTSFTTNYDEATVTRFIDGMAERNLPLSVFHFDCFWMRELNWCDFEWDARTFPDPPAMLARLKSRGLRISLWINPYIAQRSPLFAEGRDAGYLLKRPNGDVWQWDLWQPGMALVDFTNPDAREWYAAKLGALLDMGVDCFKTDFGERVPTDVAYFDGSDPLRMHNYYTYLYNETVFDLLRKRRGEGEAVLFARSATAGSQQFPVHWGGDCESSFEAMAESLRGGLSLGASGFGYWSHDIGGFEGTPDAQLFMRWVAFGLLSAHSRVHGSGSYRVPWLFGDEAVEVLGTFTRLKYQLMPYLYGAAGSAHDQGVPVMRPMVLEFPDDPACTYLERQYMLGDSLLVAPVFAADGEVSFYVPAGTWTRLRTGEPVTGPAWLTERHGVLSLPLLVRPNTVLPLGAREDRPDYDYADGVTLAVYALDEGATVTVRVPAVSGPGGASFTVSRQDGVIQATSADAVADWQVLLVGVRAVGAVSGGEAGGHEHGVLARVAGGASSIEIHLP